MRIMTKHEKAVLTEKCSAALRSVMRYRGMNVPQLARKANVPRRTVELYTQADVCLANARAATVLRMAKVLDVDPMILIGEESIDRFYEKEGIPRPEVPEVIKKLRKKNMVDLSRLRSGGRY